MWYAIIALSVACISNSISIIVISLNKRDKCTVLPSEHGE